MSPWGYKRYRYREAPCVRILVLTIDIHRLSLFRGLINTGFDRDFKRRSSQTVGIWRRDRAKGRDDAESPIWLIYNGQIGVIYRKPLPA